MRLKLAEQKKVKAKSRRSGSGSTLMTLGKGIVIYLVTIGQAIAMAQQARSQSKSGSNSNKPIIAGAKPPSISIAPPPKQPLKLEDHKHPTIIPPKMTVERMLREKIGVFQGIIPADIFISIGINPFPHTNGPRYEIESIKKLKQTPSESESAIFRDPFFSKLTRERALTDPFYSILISKEYLREPTSASIRFAEILVYQAMIQAKKPEEIALANHAYSEISKLDLPDHLRKLLNEYRNKLIRFYSISNAGLCQNIQEGGRIYTKQSHPQFFECQKIATRLDNKATALFLDENPSVQSKLEIEAVEKQNELASGTLALIAASKENYLLALALDIQRVLQFKKSASVIRLYQFSLRRLEQLLEAPHIESHDIDIISDIRILDPYFEQKILTQNERVVIAKYDATLNLVKKKFQSQPLSGSSDQGKNSVSTETCEDKHVKGNASPKIQGYFIPLAMLFSTLLFLYSFTRNVLFKHNP